MSTIDSSLSVAADSPGHDADDGRAGRADAGPDGVGRPDRQVAQAVLSRAKLPIAQTAKDRWAATS
jgi:hypothetical protein